MSSYAEGIPTEEQEMRTVCAYLEIRHLVYCHVPNEGRHKPQYRAKLAKLGVKPGVPDLLIFEPAYGYTGVAIELKRVKGGRVSSAQDDWISDLARLGWRAQVCFGAGEAIALLEEMYGGHKREAEA